MHIMVHLTKLFYQLGNIPIFNPLYINASILYKWILNFRSQPLSVNEKPIIIFSPHQDDETFGCGGLIALKRQIKVGVKVVFLTDGQKSHLATPWISPPDNLIQIRKQEAITALNILGVEASDIHFFDLIDGTLPNLTTEKYQSTINQIIEIIKNFQPGEIYVPHQKDNHPDHEYTYKLVKTAIDKSSIKVELLQYPIWIFWLSPLFFKLKLQDLTGANKLCIDSVLEQKKRAIIAYQSQHSILPPKFTESFLQNHYEIFFKNS